MSRWSSQTAPRRPGHFVADPLHDRLIAGSVITLGLVTAVVHVVVGPRVSENPDPGELGFTSLIAAQCIPAALAGLVYAAAWARNILDRRVEDYGSVMAPEPEDNSAFLPRVPRPVVTLLVGYLAPLVLAHLVLMGLVEESGDAMLVTVVALIGQPLAWLVTAVLGVIVLLPAVGLVRLARAGAVRRHPLTSALFGVLLLTVPWAFSVVEAADSPYSSRRGPDWLLLLGLQRDGVEVYHPVLLRVTQVVTYVMLALLVVAVVQALRLRAERLAES